MQICHQLFHEVHIGHTPFDKFGNPQEPELEFLASYPCSKTTFESKNVPKEIRQHFNEAERCRSVGSITGTSAYLRKTIYALCDDKEVEGRDYREKIIGLSVKESYKELLKQIKWLGDNVTKPGDEKYTIEMVDLAIEILPLIADELYNKDDRIEKVTKILSRVKSERKKEIKE